MPFLGVVWMGSGSVSGMPVGDGSDAANHTPVRKSSWLLLLRTLNSLPVARKAASHMGQCIHLLQPEMLETALPLPGQRVSTCALMIESRLTSHTNARSFQRAMGGAVYHVGSTLASLGHRCEALTLLERDLDGNEILKNLELEVSVHAISLYPATRKRRKLCTFLVMKRGENCHFRGCG